MAMMTQPSFGPRTAVMYVTTGALLVVWTGVWYVSNHNGASPQMTSFWIPGLFLSGLALLAIGMFLGPLGRAARKAELPPAEATNAEARIQQTAAARTAPVAITPSPGTAVPGNGTNVKPAPAVAAAPAAPVATAASRA